TIASETANAIAYLHSAIHPPIYHRDIKSSNILLDYNYESKVADFGLSRLGMIETSHISTAPQGTPGYVDPQYHKNFHLSDKSDVYNFGVVLVEIITAMKVVDFGRPQSEINLAELAVDRIRRGSIDEIVDPFIEPNRDAWTLYSIHKVAELAFRCLAFHSDTRPTMMEVAEELEYIRRRAWTTMEEAICLGSSVGSAGSSPRDGSEKSVNGIKLNKVGKWRGVDPVIFFKDESIIKSIEAFYGIDEQFPLDGHLVTRNSDTSNVKRIYYISKSVKNVLELNLSVGQQLKITSVGLKIFERQKSREGRSVECAFRIASEGLPLILPHITKQILSASAIDFKHLLQYKNVKCAEFVDAKFVEMVANLKPGCCVIVLGEGNKVSAEALQVDESSIAIGCWKGRASLTVMVSSIECQELLERLLMRLDRETEKGSSMHEDKPSNNVRYVEQESNGNSQDVEAN
ncbi:hypothetical protein KIW84_032003, partial [Lathyrus oleraceus]